MSLQIQQSSYSAARRRHHAVQALGEGLARTKLIGTTEAPRCHPYRHGPSLPGQIVENAPINAVDASRCQAAGRTFGHHGARPCLYGDLIRSRQHTGHSERTGNKGQQRRGHGQSTMDMSPGLSPIRPSSTRPASTESAGEPISIWRRHYRPCSVAAITGNFPRSVPRTRPNMMRLVTVPSRYIAGSLAHKPFKALGRTSGAC